MGVLCRNGVHKPVQHRLRHEAMQEVEEMEDVV